MKKTAKKHPSGKIAPQQPLKYFLDEVDHARLGFPEVISLHDMLYRTENYKKAINWKPPTLREKIIALKRKVVDLTIDHGKATPLIFMNGKKVSVSAIRRKVPLWAKDKSHYNAGLPSIRPIAALVEKTKELTMKIFSQMGTNAQVYAIAYTDGARPYIQLLMSVPKLANTKVGRRFEKCVKETFGNDVRVSKALLRGR